MIRSTLKATSACLRSLRLSAAQPFSTSASVTCKERVDQILQQPQSAVPQVYKTVKEKVSVDDKVIGRNRLIWLIKQSFGKDSASSTKVSPHHLPWFTGGDDKDLSSSKRDGRELEGITVWPHLWCVLLLKKQMIPNGYR
ncbi:hypothetical protein N0V90_009467 [Kalmusia sp. IMI 367209]|nr:hypothetical protein N0V90_009467 [Kalmusia sp. IMI 367209]